MTPSSRRHPHAAIVTHIFNYDAIVDAIVPYNANIDAAVAHIGPHIIPTSSPS